ncbi:pantetheine-phosphate adenylyltransferase [Proteiniclasticum sp. QWL-01]|uniref:pantetheine-phosphate adenylyltransferase n=1 Tax=Proteiniclasticum sp. QWL-01 TaxID=3036945 RepID=UPI0024110408|nr:pantetheine-phosphate adenylyltransferase [Proteiniclasticum sp. QWL-01]WFF74235.1 pantetheine-phosphate adenylyltransferase [Proteiniclasticum sp. QWL-01]
MVQTAVYPGSFDPISLGHLDIIERASSIFDKVIVAVLINTDKKGFFPIEERIEMIQLVTSHLPNVEVRGFSGLTVNFLKEAGARVIVRGLRVVSDFDFELQMANANRAMEPQIETLMMMTSPNYSYLSSSLVRQVMHFGGNLEGFVPGPIIERLKQNYYK